MRPLTVVGLLIAMLLTALPTSLNGEEETRATPDGQRVHLAHNVWVKAVLCCPYSHMHTYFRPPQYRRTP